MAGKFEPKTPVKLDPPKDDIIPLDVLAAANGMSVDLLFIYSSSSAFEQAFTSLWWEYLVLCIQVCQRSRGDGVATWKNNSMFCEGQSMVPLGYVASSSRSHSVFSCFSPLKPNHVLELAPDAIQSRMPR